MVITERGGAEMPDAIGWSWRGSVLIECKASLPDYYAEAKKFRHGHETLGMGKQRYFLAPKGLLKTAKVYPAWGYMEVRGHKVYTVVPCVPRVEYDKDAEMRLLAAEAKEWIMAAQGTDTEMPVRLWEDKYQAMRRASRLWRWKDQCPKCHEYTWSLDYKAK